MKILLINVTEGFAYISPSKIKMGSTGNTFIPPLGLIYLAGSLEQEGYFVKIIDYYCEQNPDKTIIDSLKDTDIVGLSVYSWKTPLKSTNKSDFLDNTNLAC